MKRKIEFYSLTNTNDNLETMPCGDHIYTWQYLDQNGNLQTDTKNVYEEIQSYRHSVDYLSRIDNFGNYSGDEKDLMYLDISNFSGDTTDLEDYLASLAEERQSVINELFAKGYTYDENTGEFIPPVYENVEKNIKEKDVIVDGK